MARSIRNVYLNTSECVLNVFVHVCVCVRICANVPVRERLAAHAILSGLFRSNWIARVQ